MSLFDFLKPKKSVQDIPPTENNTPSEFPQEKPIIDRNLFLKEPNTSNQLLSDHTSWNRIFSRIRQDYETEGYNDALSTADNKYRNDNNEILKLNLQVDIEEAEIELKEYLTEVEFHINSRKKAELFDLVEELEAKKDTCLARLKYLNQLKVELKEESGTPLRILLAYKRGFNKGLAALTVANVINKDI